MDNTVSVLVIPNYIGLYSIENQMTHFVKNQMTLFVTSSLCLIWKIVIKKKVNISFNNRYDTIYFIHDFMDHAMIFCPCYDIDSVTVLIH